MKTIAARAFKIAIIISALLVVAGPLLALVTASSAFAKAPTDCHSVFEAFVVSKRAWKRDDPSRWLEALRQELSRHGLTRAQIKDCAPQWDLVIAKIEQCVARRDMECRSTPQEADDINKAPTYGPDNCLVVTKSAVEAFKSSLTGNSKTTLDTIRQELSRQGLSRADLKQCFPVGDSLIAKLEQCVASGDMECRISQQDVETNELGESSAKSLMLFWESVLRLPHKGTDCFQGRAFGQPAIIPNPIDVENALAQLGKEKLDQILVLAANWLSSCPIEPADPSSFSDRRLTAMAIMDSVLPIKVVNTDASPECESRLPGTYRSCSLSIDYSIENKTDDRTFTNVVVGCLGGLKKYPYEAQLANVQWEPVTNSEPLDPHEIRYFSIWYGVATFSVNRKQILEGGYSKWCHVLSASAERRQSATTDDQPFVPAPTQENGLTKETNDFLMNLLKDAPTGPP
jgi:hypothetical protein